MASPHCVWRCTVVKCYERNKRFLLKMKIAWEMCFYSLSAHSATIVFLTWSQNFENKRDTISCGMGFTHVSHRHRARYICMGKPWYRIMTRPRWILIYIFVCCLVEDLLHLIKIYYRSYCWNINRNNHSRLQQSKRASIFVAVKWTNVCIAFAQNNSE